MAGIHYVAVKYQEHEEEQCLIAQFIPRVAHSGLRFADVFRAGSVWVGSVPGSPKFRSDLLLTAWQVCEKVRLSPWQILGDSWLRCTPESKMKAERGRKEKGGNGEKCGNEACLDLTLFSFTLSCHFRDMTAQTEHKTKVRTGNWEGQKAPRVVRHLSHPILRRNCKALTTACHTKISPFSPFFLPFLTSSLQPRSAVSVLLKRVRVESLWHPMPSGLSPLW